MSLEGMNKSHNYNMFFEKYVEVKNFTQLEIMKVYGHS